jgi:predicted GIY-YIG superfamily endonuclease
VRASTAERPAWCVYVLACGDGTLYTGITNDLDRRIAAHAAGRGARYTRGRGPFRTLRVEPCADKAAALVRERAIKRLSRLAKLALCAGRAPSADDGPPTAAPVA